MVNWVLPINEIYPTVTEPLESSITPAFDRRSHYRLPIRVPIFIKGVDKHGEEFLELTHTVNVSASGACFVCKRELQVEADLMVSIPAPLPSDQQESDEYDFRFPAKIIRVGNGTVLPNKKVSVRFKKLLYEK
jgi:c-di-GMP-binding flagellar brake protein YcgR